MFIVKADYNVLNLFKLAAYIVGFTAKKLVAYVAGFTATKLVAYIASFTAIRLHLLRAVCVVFKV